MKNMQSYKVTLKTLSPVFVGSGQKINKKEYVYDPKARKFYVPDSNKLFRALMSRRGLMESYEYYLVNDASDRDLFDWLKENRLIQPGSVPSWAAYSMNCTDIEVPKLKEVSTFVKDAYGKAYIPGSGLKGMLRTVILSALTYNSYKIDPDELKSVRSAMVDAKPEHIKNTATRAAGELERHFLRTLNREGTKENDAVNDIMSGFIVVDSDPIEAEKLVLCQSVDLHTDGNKNALPIMFECLPPETEIKFDLTLSAQIFKYTKDDLLGFAKSYCKVYKDYFRNAFPAVGKSKKDFIHLGGICGYATKTLAYPLMMNKAVRPVSMLLNELFPKRPRRDHKHDQDPELPRKDGKSWGVSPHTLKCTKYNGKLYEMGLCSIDFQEQG